VIKSLERRTEASGRRISVAYVYIRYSESSSLCDILGTFVRQMLERYNDLLPLFEDVYAKHHRELTQPTAEELRGLLFECHKRFDASFFVVDGLDEAMPEVRYHLLEALTALEAKVLITSRPMELLQSKFPSAKFLKISASKADIEKHVVAKIEKDSKLREVLDHGSLTRTAITTIQNKSEGM
jgi:hypothetical protein